MPKSVVVSTSFSAVICCIVFVIFSNLKFFLRWSSTVMVFNVLRIFFWQSTVTSTSFYYDRRLSSTQLLTFLPFWTCIVRLKYNTIFGLCYRPKYCNFFYILQVKLLIGAADLKKNKNRRSQRKIKVCLVLVPRPRGWSGRLQNNLFYSARTYKCVATGITQIHSLITDQSSDNFTHCDRLMLLATVVKPRNSSIIMIATFKW